MKQSRKFYSLLIYSIGQFYNMETENGEKFSEDCDNNHSYIKVKNNLIGIL